ncbi:hypothetical protein AHAS_Ahas20G0133100 [Arachis hypogaea]|uniref:Uncharacterized protein n=1 Tax=Arachis hypogaea TaxID=3818 RepID=A0A444X1I2_ARAHY|nr:hypothetical protein Ahy_B10g102201 [Arachis hypogaea]
MEWPFNGRKIVLRFNTELQPIEDGVGLLSGVLGTLGADYNKFSICEKNWKKVTGEDIVYNDCIKEMFHFDEDRGGRIKKIILQSFGSTPSQPFRLSSQPAVDGAQTKEAQRMLVELQAEVTAEKLKRNAVEDEKAAEKLKRKAVENEIAVEKIKRQAIESVMSYLIQR